MSGQPREPRGVFNHEGEGGLVTPRSLEAEAGHPEHDQIGTIGPEGLVVETQLVQHAWGVVLDDHVARSDEAMHQIDALWLAQVDGQALLVGVERGKDRAPLPVALLRLRDPTDQAGPIGPGRRFEVDHFGAEERQHVPGEWARPVRGHVEDPQPLEGERRRTAGRAPSRSLTWQGAVDRQLSEAGGGCGRTEACRPQPERRRRIGRPVPRVDRERFPVEEVLERCDVRAVGDGSVGDAEGRGQVQDLVDGVRGDPGVDDGRQLRPVEEERSVLHPLRVLDHDAEIEPLLPGPAPQPDQSVLGRADTRGRDEPLASHRPTELVVERHRVVGQAHGQGFEHRHVDELAVRVPAPDRGQGPDGGEDDRRAIRRPAHRRAPGRGLGALAPTRRSLRTTPGG